MNPANSVRIVPRSWTRTDVAVDALGDGGPLGGPDDGATLAAPDAGAVVDGDRVGAPPPQAASRSARTTTNDA
jgi:hypothetical protein